MEYNAMNLNIPNEVTKAARPSLINVTTEPMPFSIFAVNGAATDAWTITDKVWIWR